MLLASVRTVTRHRIDKLSCMIAVTMTMMMTMMWTRRWWYMSSIGKRLSLHFSLKLFDSSLDFRSKVKVFLLHFFAFLHGDNNYNNIITLTDYWYSNIDLIGFSIHFPSWTWVFSNDIDLSNKAGLFWWYNNNKMFGKSNKNPLPTYD